MISEEIRTKSQENKQKIGHKNSNGDILVFLSRYQISYFEIALNDPESNNMRYLEGGYLNYLREGIINEDAVKPDAPKLSRLISYKDLDPQTIRMAKDLIMSLGDMEYSIKKGIFDYLDAKGKKPQSLLKLFGFKSFNQDSKPKPFEFILSFLTIYKKFIFVILAVLIFGIQATRIAYMSNENLCKDSRTELCLILDKLRFIL